MDVLKGFFISGFLLALFSTFLCASPDLESNINVPNLLNPFEADGTDDHSQPRLLIGTGQAITKNTRRISDLRTISGHQNIHVFWNMTPLSVEGFPCCPFTLLEVYPLNAAGRKIPGESIVLLKPNITEYPVNVSHVRKETQVQEYMICVRLWHRFAGKERKLDEDCIKTRAVRIENGDHTVLIVFAIVLSVNGILLSGVAVLVVVKRRRHPSFTMKKWWRDVSEVLQSQPSRASLESRLTMSTTQRRPSGLSAGSLNNGMSVPTSPSISHSRMAIATISGPVILQPTHGATGNEYTYSRCLNNQVYDLFLHRPAHYCVTRPANEICTVRNGLFNDPADVVVV